MKEIEMVIKKLERMNKGSNVHTINKALFYLQLDNYRLKNQLVILVNKAYNVGNWNPVKKVLARLF